MTEAAKLSFACCWKANKPSALTVPSMMPMTMKAWLVGHEFDLEDLTDLLPAGDVRVVKEGDRYYLTSSEIDNQPDGLPYYEIAPLVLQRVNGLGRAYKPEFRPVALSGTYQDGDQQHVVVQVDSAEVRVRAGVVAVVTNSDGEPLPQPDPPGPQRASLAATHPDVAEALTIMGQPGTLGWVEMYKVYEIIKASVRPRTIEQLGWTTAADDSAFRASANRPDVSGAGARHSRMPSGTPRHRMTEIEGRQFLSRLVTTWLDSLS